MRYYMVDNAGVVSELRRDIFHVLLDDIARDETWILLEGNGELEDPVAEEIFIANCERVDKMEKVTKWNDLVEAAGRGHFVEGKASFRFGGSTFYIRSDETELDDIIAEIREAEEEK